SISGGSLALSQSTIADDHGGGVQVTFNATFKIVSDVFAHNGRGGTSVGALSIASRSSTENELEFCTFYANEAMEGVGAAVECNAGVTARYNIMSANGGPMTPTEIHGNCSYEYTITSPGTPIPGATNHQADPRFVNPAAAELSDRDFHVLPDSAAVLCADPMVEFTDDTKYDIEDKPRTRPATLGAYQVPDSVPAQ
ncbi:MAG TPA: right-handed parallel beta-helix repeat-containing protein, partial [Kofleriaceae bacterium]|nr:right-handed parallel beta-helix repeat-containing protein [Kofleriaceae bacterium]